MSARAAFACVPAERMRAHTRLLPFEIADILKAEVTPGQRNRGTREVFVVVVWAPLSGSVMLS